MTFFSDITIHYIINLIITIYLIFCTWKDIKTKTVSLLFSFITACILLILQLVFADNHFSYYLYALIPGIFLLFISFCTRQSLGYGDCIVFLTIGIGLGFSSLLLVTIVAFILSAVYSLFLIIKRKSGKTEVPFLPFILTGFLLTKLL